LIGLALVVENGRVVLDRRRAADRAIEGGVLLRGNCRDPWTHGQRVDRDSFELPDFACALHLFEFIGLQTIAEAGNQKKAHHRDTHGVRSSAKRRAQ
jgi:hypothetical protein